MKPIIEVNDEMDVGITPSVDLNDVLFWENGGNVLFRRKSISPLVPHIQGFEKPESVPIRGIFECIIDAEEHIFFGTQTKLYRWTKSAGVVNVSRLAGGAYTGKVNTVEETHPVFGNVGKFTAAVWHFSQWGRWVVATNGRDVPQLYIPDDGEFRNLDTENSGNLTFNTAHLMLPFKGFMFALNTAPLTVAGNGGENFAHFSELDDLEKWDPTVATNKYAADLPIRDADGPIMAALVTDDALFFTTAHALHAITFVGAPELFGAQKLATGCGSLSKQCFVAHGRTFFGAGMQGIWQSDGVQVQYIDEPFIHKYVYEDLNFAQKAKCVLWLNVFEEMLEFHYPSKNSIEVDKAVGFNYRDGNWTIIDRVRTSAATNAILTFGVTANANGEVAFQAIGSALDNTTTRGGLDAKPFTMEETMEGIEIGFGDGGFGEGGYGGLARRLRE